MNADSCVWTLFLPSQPVKNKGKEKMNKYEEGSAMLRFTHTNTQAFLNLIS